VASLASGNCRRTLLVPSVFAAQPIKDRQRRGPDCNLLEPARGKIRSRLQKVTNRYAGQVVQHPGLASSGNINGNANTPAKVGFTGQVTDSTGATASKGFSLSVVPKFGITTSSPVAAGIVGVPYFQIFGAIGGTQPYQWSIGRALPAGLGFTSDGVISGVPAAPGMVSVDITVRDASSNVATGSFVVSVQPAAAVDLILSAGSLAFSAQPGGSAPPPQSFGVNATGTNSVQFSASAAGASWLRLATASGPTPGSISVFADQTGLTPGLYQATLTVTSPNASSKSVPVSLAVAAGPASISVSPSSLQLFAPATASGPVTSAIQLSSSSATSAAFQTNVVDLPFLTVSPQQGSIAQNSPVVLNLSADTRGLVAGFYRSVEITAGGATATAYVTVQVGTTGKLILSSQGTTLDAQVGTAIAGPATQSFTVLGADATPLHFTASIVGSAPFLTLSSTGGVASLSQPATVPFTVSSMGLPLGAYYGRIRITSHDVENSPLEYLVVLNVRATGVTPDLNPFPSGLAFLPGGASQTIQAFTDSGPLFNLQVAVTTQSGGSWLSAQVSKNTISTSPAQVSVRVNAAGITPGIYRGFVALAPSSAQVRTVAVTLVVPGNGPVASPADGQRPEASPACAPSQLALSHAGLSGNFTTAAAWPKLIHRAIDG
jgi:large repetitive protein